jgi:hypothetical protein
MQTLLTGGSLIQGHFPGVPRQGSAPLRNLEAVLLRARGAGRWDLEHRWRDQNVPDRPWQVGSVVTSNATGPGAICQRTNKGDVQGNFEVVVPESGGLAHYWLDNSVSGLRSWNGFGLLAPGSTGPGAVLENNLNGNLEVIVAHHSDLVHYWFDRIAWRAGSVITRRASGAPAMIQSDYNGHLEVVVPEGEHLVLYWLDWTQPPRWRRGGVITERRRSLGICAGSLWQRSAPQLRGRRPARRCARRVLAR